MRMATACGAAPAQIMRYMQASWEIQQTGMRLKGSVQIRMRLQLDQMEILQAVSYGICAVFQGRYDP